MAKGKAYANKKKKEEQPQGDFYGTPRSLVWELNKHIDLKRYPTIYDPCCGANQILKALEPLNLGNNAEGSDLFPQATSTPQYDIYDFMPGDFNENTLILTNFPFSEWDQMVIHCLDLGVEVITIGRLNYLGTQARLRYGLWDFLYSIRSFSRMIDYRSPDREDGCFHTGMLVTGWFHFKPRKKDPSHPFAGFHIDVNKYATLGTFKEAA